MESKEPPATLAGGSFPRPVSRSGDKRGRENEIAGGDNREGGDPGDQAFRA